jgi:hypothetical protein
MRLRAGARNGLFPATHQATICPFKRVRVHDRLQEPRREFLQQNIAEVIIRPKYLISVSSAISLASGDVSNRGFQPTHSKCFRRWPDCGQALREILCSATSPAACGLSCLEQGCLRRRFRIQPQGCGECQALPRHSNGAAARACFGTIV